MGRNDLKLTLQIVGAAIGLIGLAFWTLSVLAAIIIAVIGFVIFMIGAFMKTEEEMPEGIEAAFYAQGYSVTEKADPLYIDSVNKKWAVLEQDIGIKDIFSFSDILNFELIEDGQRYEQRGGVTRAVVGGAIFGTVGAVVGSQTAKGKSSISQMYICVYTKQSNRSFVKINLINSATSTDSGAYIDAKDRALLIMSKFAIMQHEDREEAERKSSYSDAAEQIKKYKELLDCGALTREEFEDIKKKLMP